LRTTHRQFINFKTGLPNADWHTLSVFTTNTNTAVNFDGGQVDITSGKFVFSANEAYLIKNGKISHPVKGATLIGSGDEALKKISMVANDLKLDSGVGVCGKDVMSYCKH
jgi:predicted Zn-dependent protease